ncbi:protein serine/threonine phosphatase 2C [Pleomassaria siparia CBS 279.74]|uniref:Protein serine/threonine phosphatase 2C n=1 Tax=Pleomassaria siparia CBS 279.74 TaxID=1314801 RepID=A0A6G1KMQ6_9PLEO|nr:protein serine/threonine phosphatase 2C [Pleomassaria siparia CBS 279.74]
MVPGQLRTTVRRLGARAPNIVPIRLSPLPHGTRTFLRPSPPTALSQRVLVQSRALRTSRPLLSWRPQSSSHLAHNHTRPSSSHYSQNCAHILQSRFPTKTTIFILFLGALYYFDIIGIDDEESTWIVRMFQSLGEPEAIPLHVHRNREDVEHHFQHHIPDIATTLQDPGFLQMVNDSFEKMAGGWQMDVEDAKTIGMPITHGCRFRSNTPCEDYFALGSSPGPGDKLWNFWAVFDGHAGNQTAQYLHWNLINQISRSLLAIHPASSSETIENTIKQTFLRVDNEIMSRGKYAGNWLPTANASAITALIPAFSGSCALLAAFDVANSKLRVACTGDSRAVLGRWDPVAEKYTCHPLSVDQTGFNQLEVDRIKAEHPGEDNIIDPKTGRLLGIAVTRAFGDHRWKWDNDLVKQMQIKFWGTAPRPGNATPPYMTAEPVVTEIDVVRTYAKDKKGKSDFMIMASDGLWDRISSEHAVECVQHWLEAKDRGKGKVSEDPKRVSPSYPGSPQVDPGVTYNVETSEPISWKATPEYFSIEDDNAAICLARNALGGNRKSLFIGILSIPDPRNRYAVDDTTVMVVFFDKVEKEGEEQMIRLKGGPTWWWPFGRPHI